MNTQRSRFIFASMILFLGLAAVALSSGIFRDTGIVEASTVQPTAVPTPQKQAIKTKPSSAKMSLEFTNIYDGNKIVKTEAEWKKLLSPAQYNVLRQQGTERAYTGEYTDSHEDGTYHCAACGLAVFSSNAKFESGTGWPSFFQPVAKANVTEIVDNKLADTRTEINCSRCGSHLGHVFDDGPEPTGLRYCVNSVALKFKKAL